MRGLRLLFALLLCCGVAQASPLGTFVQGPASAPAGYQGPLDVVGTNPKFAGGARLLRAAYSGHILQVQVGVSGSTVDIDAAADGTIDASANTATCNSATCYLVKLYDQATSPLGDCASINGSGSAQRAFLVANSQNGHYFLQGAAGGVSTCELTFSSTWSGAYTMHFVGTTNAPSANDGLMDMHDSANAGWWGSLYQNSSNDQKFSSICGNLSSHTGGGTTPAIYIGQSTLTYERLFFNGAQQSDGAGCNTSSATWDKFRAFWSGVRWVQF